MVAPSREVSDWLREVDLRKQGEKMSSRWQFAERHPLMSNLILMTVAVITTILAVDLTAFYLLGMRRVGHGPERFFQYSSLLGWQHKPNAEGIWYAYKDGTKTFVRVNSFGYPDSQREVLKERPRIALIGDSTTEFWEVEEERRGQFVLEGRLNGEVEVLNFGLRGAGTDQIYLRLGQQVQYFSPDIVIATRYRRAWLPDPAGEGVACRMAPQHAGTVLYAEEAQALRRRYHASPEIGPAA
jgi:hypothetical protein